MTTVPLDTVHLGIMASEWQAERQAFLASVQTYLTTQLPRVQPAQRLFLAPQAYYADLTAVGERLVDFLRTLDATQWYTLQHSQDNYQRALAARFAAAVEADSLWLSRVRPLADTAPLHRAVRHALALMQYILHLYDNLHGQFDLPTIRFVARLASHMKYMLYPVRHHLPALLRYWLLPDADADICEPLVTVADPATGIRHYVADGQRGAYTTYIPEYYRDVRAWPLVLALHGGHGNDVDFLWAWLPYAKSHGYLLVSAKSFAPTWYPWDAASLLRILDEIQTRYRVDTARILLVGLSDGGSFGYEVGFAYPERFAGLAVVAGTLQPLQRHPLAHRLPVYIAHGEEDALFPVTSIRQVVPHLQGYGHHVTYHELAGFGHAYPPGENAAILAWFEGLRDRA